MTTAQTGHAREVGEMSGTTERSAFEAWAREHHSIREADWFKESILEDGLFPELPDSWAAWKARAALAQPVQPAADAQALQDAFRAGWVKTQRHPHIEVGSPTYLKEMATALSVISTKDAA